MQIFYRVSPCPHDTTRFAYEEVGRPWFCCDHAEAEWGELVGFGCRGTRRGDRPEVYFYSSFFTSCGEHYTAVTPISNCPWCGELFEPIKMQ